MMWQHIALSNSTWQHIRNGRHTLLRWPYEEYWVERKEFKLFLVANNGEKISINK